MSYDTNFHVKPEHPQLIFIHGFGTTSLVHALAEQYNFKVIPSGKKQPFFYLSSRYSRSQKLMDHNLEHVHLY